MKAPSELPQCPSVAAAERQLRAARRELNMRKLKYPGWVALKKIKQHVADDELAAMQGIVATLEWVVDLAKRRRKVAASGGGENG